MGLSGPGVAGGTTGSDLASAGSGSIAGELRHQPGAQPQGADQLLVDDKDTFRHFGFARTPAEEQAASAKAIELLNKSPYKNQLGNANLFLTALQNRQQEIPNLISAHLGDQVPAIVDLKTVASTPEQKNNPQLIAALPIGGRVKLDPYMAWSPLLSAQATRRRRAKMT